MYFRIISRNTIIILIVFFVYVGLLRAQFTNIKFDKIGLEEGLSQSTVYAITQDVQGFMWFGTLDGLNRFDGYSIKVFQHNTSDSNSISDNTIWSLLSDRNGNLWIGTEHGGLNLYIPSENKFFHYLHNENDSTTISENFITALFEDSKGNIWVGTPHKGLNFFNKESKTFTHFIFDEKDTARAGSNNIRSICEDRSGYLWIATQQGLYKIKIENTMTDTLQPILYRHITSDPFSLSENNVTTLCDDKQGTLWIGTWGGGLTRFDDKTESFIKYNRDNNLKNSLSGDYIAAIYEDSEGYLWIGTHDGGLNLYNSKENKFTQYIDESVTALYEDNSGVIWVGTLGNGVRMFDRRKNKFIHYYDNPNNADDLHGNMVSAILVDKDGELWVGTWSYGINRFDKDRKKIKNYNSDPKNFNSLGSDRVYALCESSDGDIWAGTLSGGLDRFNKRTGKFTHYKHNPKNPNTIQADDVSALFYDEQENVLWIGYSAGGISSYDISKGAFKHFVPDEKNPDAISGSDVMVIYKGKKSGLWIGTLRGGVNRFIARTNSFNNYQKSGESNTSKLSGKSINSNGVFCVYEDTKGIVWIGTYGGGLNRYEPATGLFTYYTTQTGLPNDVVYGILPDSVGNLWLSTNNGLSRFSANSNFPSGGDYVTDTFRNFDVSEGLQSNEFNSGAYFASKNGELFFGGVNGFNAFFPDEIEDNKYIPPVYLTTFKVFDKVLPFPNPVPGNSTIELSYFQNFFSFEFVALNYSAPEKSQYAYMLEGFDNDWHKVSSSQRYASYTNLDPGKYTLHIKGSNNDGVWNEAGTSVTIVINPPFWMTWWFRTFGIVLFLSSVFLFYKRRITTLKREKELQQEISSRLIEKQEEERKRIALEIHDSLGPNLVFIKNRANSIVKKDFNAQSANESFNQISSAASGVLNSVREISHNLRPPELDQLGLTETLRSILLTARESTAIAISGEVNNIDELIPHDLEINLVRILQESLSNVLKHSMADKCEVIVKTIEDKVLLTVSDNGKGFMSDNNQNLQTKSGLGLTGMTERVRMLGGTFEIDSTEGKGTRIKIQIPIRKSILKNK